MLEAEARERQLLAVHQTNASLGREHEQTLVELIPQASEGKSRDKAAELVCVNPRYISDAKHIKEDAPEVFHDMQAGALTMPQARALAADTV